jgi:hypothetical protein
MGWLFDVALGLHRRDRRNVWLSLAPIAAGHAFSTAVAAIVFVWAGLVFDARLVRIGSGLLLIGWAVYHWRYGHRHRVRVGMQAGLAGLALWSFLMATAHGAGLMLWPALMPLCTAAATAAGSSGAAAVALLGVAVHTAAMLVVTAAIAVAVYEFVGVEILRHAWINVDILWMCGLLVTGIWLLVS